METISFVNEITVDTDIPFDDYAYRFEKNAIVQLNNGKIGKVLHVERNSLDVLYRVNLNTWRIEHWPKEHCERKNYITTWYHENPFDAKKKFDIPTTVDKMDVDDEYIVPFTK